MDIDKMEKMKNYYEKKVKPNLDKVALGILILGFIVLGLFSSELFFYYFGLIFFLAGWFAGSAGPKVFGLIFLFSHGGTGLSFMVYSLCSNFFGNPRFTDSPNFMQYVIIVVVTIFIATACVFVSNLTNPFDTDSLNKKMYSKKRWYQVMTLGLYFLALLLMVVFLRII